MKDVYLLVTSLGTDWAGETLHYEVTVGDVRITGDFVGRSTDGEEPYRYRIATAPDGDEVTLHTPDARLAISAVQQVP